MSGSAWRWPAEWEPQSAVLLAWPHDGTDWRTQLQAVEASYVALVRAITTFEPAIVLVADGRLADHVRRTVGPTRHALSLIEYDYQDTWLRDSGPITLVGPEGICWLDFRFTGWGGKYAAAKDDALVASLAARPEFAHVQYQRVDFALEGGAIESDGAGTVLTTWACLERRHPGRSRADLAATLRATLASTRVLGLEHGELEGDDTDAHIDTLARFVAPDAIVYQACSDERDPHYPALAAMRAEIEAWRRPNGAPYRTRPLPWAGEVRAADGRRLAASYANFLILNDAILVPGYGVPSDQAAVAVLAGAFPGREIVSIPGRPLIEQNGSLHCLTMQLPQGVWRVAS